MFREPAEPLMIDRSPVPAPEEAEVLAWAADQSVFISSVISGMNAERQAATDAISSLGARPILFETFGGMDDDPEDAYLAHVASSDIYLGILGSRYGKPLKTRYSATHAEYNEAVRRGLRVSVWNAMDDLDGRQQDFLDEVRVFHTTGSYGSPESLTAGVERRLRIMAAESITPWVKIGNTLLRATSVQDDGARITVKARVRDNTVAANIEGRRPSSSYGRNSDTLITWPGGTTPVRVTNVTTETSSARTRTMTIVADRIDGPRSNLIEASFEGRSPEDLTELTLRVALFGEPNPLGTMSFMAQAENPLPALEGLGVSEDAYERIAELLVIELLVGARGVDHLTHFRLGPHRAGSRRLRLAWMPSRRYTNVDPVERTIEGEAVIT